MSTIPLKIGFSGALIGNTWDGWLHLVQRFMHVHLSGKDDIFTCKLSMNGKLTIKCMYLDFFNGHTRFYIRIFGN
jgi:hypothetical protein